VFCGIFLSCKFNITAVHLCRETPLEKHAAWVTAFPTTTMSKAQNPMTGQMSGSMANFVTTTHGGANVIRSKAFNQQDAKTEAQQKQRGGFKMLAEEYVGFGGVTDQGFPECPKGMSAYNLFMAANLPAAIDKSGAEPIVDYSKMVVANGTLPSVVVTGGEVTPTGITIGYQTNLLIPKVSATDEVVAVVKTTVGELLVTKQARGGDTAGNIIVAYPGISVADVKCCYLFVRTVDGMKSTKSVYVPLS